MEKKEISRGILYITYAALLVCVLVYFKDIVTLIRNLLNLAGVFLLGIAIAFVLNRFYEKLRAFYKKMHLKDSYAKYSAVVSLYSLILLGLIAFISLAVQRKI